MPSQASLLAGLLISGAVFAQEFRASVAGQVTDSTGATVPGAEVVVTSLERNTSFRTVSNSAGRYVLEFLLPGHYTLTAEKSGFKKLVRTGISIEAADRLALDISLQLGDLTQSVTVTSETELLETETASRAGVIENRVLENVPPMAGTFSLCNTACRESSSSRRIGDRWNFGPMAT